MYHIAYPVYEPYPKAELLTPIFSSVQKLLVAVLYLIDLLGFQSFLIY
jgi:hypothetical protein